MRKSIGLMLAMATALGAGNASTMQQNTRIEQQAQKSTAIMLRSFSYSYGRLGTVPGFRNYGWRRSIQKSFLPVSKRRKRSNKIQHSKLLKLKHRKNAK